MPDIFVPQDTTGVTSYFMNSRGLIPRFCFQYTDTNRQYLQEYKTVEELLKYLKG